MGEQAAGTPLQLGVSVLAKSSFLGKEVFYVARIGSNYS